MRQAVRLPLEDVVELARVAVDRGETGVERARQRGLGDQRREPLREHQLVAMALPAGFFLVDSRGRQAHERVADELELGVAGLHARATHDHAERARRDRELGLVRAHGVATVGVAHDAEPAAGQRAAVAFGEDRQHDAVVARPVDVEEVRVRTRAAVLEHVEPPAVAAARNRHVIRHDVDNHRHALGAHRGGQAVEPIVAAQGGRHALGVHRVVAVGRALGGLEDRRQVEVADAELREVRHHGDGVVERERGAQLQPVGRAPRRHGCSRRSSISDRPTTRSAASGT